MAAVSAPADAVVAAGPQSITTFLDRDMVALAGYPVGLVVSVDVLRGGVSVGHTSGPTVADPKTGEGILEVNHGPAGTPAPGECWDATPNIVAGDVIQVTATGVNDSMTVADVGFPSAPVDNGGTVSMQVSGADAAFAADPANAGVEFRNKTPRFRPGAEFDIYFTSVTNATGALVTFHPQPTTSAKVAPDRALTPAEQLNAALTAPWRATIDPGGLTKEVTIAESDGVNGPAAGCPAGPVTPPPPPPPPPGDHVPTAPTIGAATAGDAQATVNWTAPADLGVPALVEYDVRVRNVTTGTSVIRTVAAPADHLLVTGLTNNNNYDFQVRGVQAAGTSGPFSAFSTPVVTPTGPVTPPPPPATRPSAPTIGLATSGSRTDGRISATARWTAPTSTGGSAITGYLVRAHRMSSTGAILQTTTSTLRPAGARSFSMTLQRAGQYRFTVVARNSVGDSVASQPSNQVAGR